MESTLTEFTVFWGCLYGGFCIGILYECFSLVALLWENRFFRAFLDLLFYSAALGLSALFLLYLNGGRPRFYTLFTFTGGAVFFRYSAGTFFRHLLCRIRNMFSHF